MVLFQEYSTYCNIMKKINHGIDNFRDRKYPPDDVLFAYELPLHRTSTMEYM